MPRTIRQQHEKLRTDIISAIASLQKRLTDNELSPKIELSGRLIYHHNDDEQLNPYYDAISEEGIPIVYEPYADKQYTIQWEDIGTNMMVELYEDARQQIEKE